MSNMSYCRFENTLRDLRDCAEHLSDDTLSREEKRCREQLVEECQWIIDNYEDYEDEDEEEEEDE